MCDSRVAFGRTSYVLTLRRQFLLSQGLAPSTRRVYLSAQRRLLTFAAGMVTFIVIAPSLLPRLMRFSSLLADNLATHPLKYTCQRYVPFTFTMALSGPFVNCLRLPCLLRGIKRVPGPVSPRPPLITLDHLQAIQRGLDFSRRDHVTL